MSLDPIMMKAFQDDATDILGTWEKSCLEAATNKAEVTYQTLMRCAHNLKGNASLIGFDALAETMHRLEDRLLKLQQAGVHPSTPKLVGLLLDVEKFVRSWINSVIQDPTFKPDHLNWLTKLEAWDQETYVAETEPSEKPAKTEVFVAETPVQETLRIPAEKLDRLIQLVGELTLAQAIVTRGRMEDRMDAAQVREAIALCDKITRNLRGAVLDLRMLPIAGIFQRLERAAMELSVRLQKPVQFLASGQEVSLDKVVIERIFDPLLHIVRNAIDHGLESPEERMQSGKAKTGNISIDAELGATGVVVKIQDDGKGLSPEKIMKKAKEQGLVRPDEVLSESEMISLIFRPGFSTAATITDISGRGVGLDVVQKEVNRLGGQVVVSSKVGDGTTFQISLPTNISLIDVLVVQSAGITYAVPTQDLSEILSLTEHKMESSVMFDRMILLRDKVVPVEKLERFLPSGGRIVHPASGISETGSILIVQYQNELVGFEAEAVLGQQQVFVRPLKGYLANLPWLTGATILSSGEPSMILNLSEMAKDYWSGVWKNKDRQAPMAEN